MQNLHEPSGKYCFTLPKENLLGFVAKNLSIFFVDVIKKNLSFGRHKKYITFSKREIFICIKII